MQTLVVLQYAHFFFFSFYTFIIVLALLWLPFHHCTHHYYKTKNIKNVTRCRDSRTANSKETNVQYKYHYQGELVLGLASSSSKQLQTSCTIVHQPSLFMFAVTIMPSHAHTVLWAPAHISSGDIGTKGRVLSRILSLGRTIQKVMGWVWYSLIFQEDAPCNLPLTYQSVQYVVNCMHVVNQILWFLRSASSIFAWPWVTSYMSDSWTAKDYLWVT